MKPVRNHQLDSVRVASRNHRYTVVLAGCHWLFTEHMDACLCRLLRIFTMESVGQSDIYGVNLSALQALLVARIGIGMCDAIFLAQPLQLHIVVGDQSNQLRIAASMHECGQNRCLGDVAKTDDGIPDSFFNCQFIYSGGTYRYAALRERLEDFLGRRCWEVARVSASSSSPPPAS